MNFGIGSAFSKGPGSAFSEGPDLGPGPLMPYFPNDQRKTSHFQFIIKICSVYPSKPKSLSIKCEYHELRKCTYYENNLSTKSFNVRKRRLLKSKNPDSVEYGAEPIFYLALSSSIVRETIKNSKVMKSFRKKK